MPRKKEITDKQRLMNIEGIVHEIDSANDEKKSINEEILSTKLGVRRKELNSRISKLKMALDDSINKVDNFNPKKQDLDAYIDSRKVHTGQFAEDPDGE